MQSREIEVPSVDQVEIEEMEERFPSSSGSSPSSLFSIPPPEDDAHLLSQLNHGVGGVHREGTATPSDMPGGSGGAVEGAKDKKEGGKEEGGAGEEGDKSPETQNDMNSEPNDSSGEEDSGEDAQTVMDTLSQRLEAGEGGTSMEGVPAIRGGASMSPGAEGEGGRDGGNARLALLRKQLLCRLVDGLNAVEEVGGMRAMSYLQVGGAVRERLSGRVKVRAIYSLPIRIPLGSR